MEKRGVHFISLDLSPLVINTMIGRFLAKIMPNSEDIPDLCFNTSGENSYAKTHFFTLKHPLTLNLPRLRHVSAADPVFSP